MTFVIAIGRDDGCHVRSKYLTQDRPTRLDAGRLPVYLVKSHGAIGALAVPIAIATLGVIIGTLAGEKILSSAFRASASSSSFQC